MCYRPEIGRGKKESRLYRVHEFLKIEMFTVSSADDSEKHFEDVIKIQQKIFDDLKLHYRYVILHDLFA